METSFEKVWKRVNASEPFDDAAKLQGFIRNELRDADDYIRIARKSRAPGVRKLLTSFAGDERRHAQKLLAVGYLQFGRDNVPAEREKKGDERILSALRRRYSAELESAEAYSRTAEVTADKMLKKLYLELAQEEQKHAETLWAMFEQMM